MVRIAHSINLSIDADSGDSLGAFSRDPRIYPDLRVSSEAFDGYQVGSISLPADGTPVRLSLGALSDVRGFYIEVRGPGSAALWIDPSGPVEEDTPGALVVRPTAAAPGGGAQFAHFYADVSVSALWLASTGAVALEGAYAVWGNTRPAAA